MKCRKTNFIYPLNGIMLTLSIVIISIIVLTHWDGFAGRIYDIYTDQSEIRNKADIDKQLSHFETIPYNQIDNITLGRLGFNSSKYYSIYHDKEFLIIDGSDRYKYIICNKRLKDLLPEDRYTVYHAGIPKYRNSQLMLIEKSVLYKTLELFNFMMDSDYDINQIHITSGFRPPKYNQKVNGASKSRHLYGDAIDISVHDINKDGIRNSQDVKTIYNILNKEIIKNNGSLGKYKHYPFLIHFDTRGPKSNGLGARWFK